MQSSVRTSAPAALLLIFLALAAAPATAAATSGPARAILTSGDLVDGFGAIGDGQFYAFGIDASGRVLFSAELNSNESGAFRADASGTETLWIDPAGSQERLTVLQTNSGGMVVGAGNQWRTLYDVHPPTLTPRVSVGDLTADSSTICNFGRFALGNGGALAFFAYSVPRGRSCESDEWTQSIFLLDTAPAHRRLGPFGTETPGRTLLGLADDGSIGVDLELAGQTFVLHSDGTRTTVAAGDRDPSGHVFAEVIGLNLSASGALVFYARANDLGGIYRLTDRGIETVVRDGDALPGGATILSVDRIAWMNAGGDVVTSGSWTDGSATLRGTIIVPRAAMPVTVERSSPGGINDAGAVALQFDGTRVARWQSGVVETLVSSGDRAPNGAAFAINGLNLPGCLGADGRAAIVGYNNTNGEALLCVDADGPHRLTVLGDPSPDGGLINGFIGCAAADGDQFLFSAYRISPDGRQSDAGVYRATSTAIDRAVGPGQVTANGAVVSVVVGGVGTADLFTANQAGTVLTFAQTESGQRLLRRRRGGPLEEVSFDYQGDPLGRTVAYINWAGIAADDSVVGAALLIGAGAATDALLVSDGTQARLLLDGADPRLPGAPVQQISQLVVRGDRIFAAGNGDDGRYHAFVVALADGSVRPVVSSEAGSGAPWIPIDFSAAGRLLFDHDESGLPRQYVLFEDDQLVELSDDLAPNHAIPIGINDRGNLLSLQLGLEVFDGAALLRRTGPDPVARCFVPPTAIPQPIATPTPSPTPIDCAAGDSRCLYLDVGTASGLPGDRVTVEVRLASGNHEVAGVQLDLEFLADAPFTANDLGRPACRVNPAIHKDNTAYNFLPDGCSPGDDCAALRALVLSLTNVDAIPDGAVLFECDLDIAAGAPPGRLRLAGTNGGFSDPLGNALQGIVRAGAVEVLAASDAPTGAGAAAGSGGCQIGLAPRTPLWSLLVVAAWAVLRRRRRTT